MIHFNKLYPLLICVIFYNTLGNQAAAINILCLYMFWPSSLTSKEFILQNNDIHVHKDIDPRMLIKMFLIIRNWI